jgi:uroporphyrinogen decarboxylase
MSMGMSPMERVLTTLRHQEPDRVPLLLSLTMHGAKALGMSIESYYSKSENLVKGQESLFRRYGHDVLNTFTHASAEFEAFGGTTTYYEDGPPNSGKPVILAMEDIERLERPDPLSHAGLRVIIDATRGLREAVGPEVPILGVVISPFSMPVMQMGFENYFDLMYTETKAFEHLVHINESFAVEFANLQFEAGATAMVLFDPVSSTTIIPRDKYIETGFKSAKRTIRALKGPVFTHFASGRILPIIDKIIETGTIGVGVSTDEDLGTLKRACGNRLTLVGNLNGVEMPNWNVSDVDRNVKEAIRKGASGGGFILSDNHGEIPYQVSDRIIEEIAKTTYLHGKYPIRV